MKPTAILLLSLFLLSGCKTDGEWIECKTMRLKRASVVAKFGFSWKEYKDARYKILQPDPLVVQWSGTAEEGKQSGAEKFLSVYCDDE